MTTAALDANLPHPGAEIGSIEAGESWGPSVTEREQMHEELESDVLS